MAVDLQRLRVITPIVGAAALFTTLAICFIITRVRGIYVGGLVWPFFSDMGREAPAYYVFITGLSIVGVALSFMWQINGMFQRSVFTEATPCAFYWAVTTATWLGASSPIGLPLLAIFDTSTYAMTHAVTTGLFFFFQTLAMIINFVVTYHLYTTAKHTHSQLSPTSREKFPGLTRHFVSVRRTFVLQAVACTLFFVAFIVYVPVGMAIADDYTRLTIQQCLDRRLGDVYCTHTVKLNDVDTKLWNYEIGFGLNQFRSLMQLSCILTLLGYTGSFVLHDFDSVASVELATIQSVVLSPVGVDGAAAASPLSHAYARLEKTRTSSASEICLA